MQLSEAEAGQSEHSALRQRHADGRVCVVHIEGTSSGLP
jgi:hypothetical protein